MLLTPHGKMHQYGPDEIYLCDKWVRDLNDGHIQAIHIHPGGRYGRIELTFDRPKTGEYSEFEYVDEDDLV